MCTSCNIKQFMDEAFNCFNPYFIATTASRLIIIMPQTIFSATTTFSLYVHGIIHLKCTDIYNNN